MSQDDAPEDYLTKTEMAQLREAALEYGSLPSYNNLSPLDRDRWKTYLSQRLGIPKSELGRDKCERAHSWKFPSLVWTALDTGLRPDEFERAKTYWLDLENKVLQIPKGDESYEEWIVSIREDTARALEEWLAECAHYEKYGESDQLWLTHKRNPYQSNLLNYLLRKLCDIGEIESDDRQITWFTLRDSVGKLMAEDGDIELVQKQLRYKSRRAERRYKSDVENGSRFWIVYER